MILRYISCDSTQNVAKKLIDETKINQDFTLITTEEMTNGKTRKENVSWFSPKGNLYISIIVNIKAIKFEIESQFASSLAMIDALKEFINTDLIQIKWPNDLLIKNFKIAGSMAEKYENFIIFGMAINLTKSPEKTLNFPASHITNFFQKITFNEEKIQILTRKIFNSFISYVHLLNEHGFELLQKKIEEKLYKKNEKITILLEKNEKISGKLIGINSKGELLILKDDNSCMSFFYGEISYF